MDLQLSGRSILVTGGSSGIGLATARLLLAEGSVVAICGRNAERLRAAEAALDSDRLRVVRADVLEPDEAAEAVRLAAEHGGGLDGIACIAGRGRHGGLLDIEPADVAQEVSDKLLGLLNIVRPAIPALAESAGRVVGLTAPTALAPNPSMGAIGIGRAALGHAIATLASELAPSNIAVNAVGVGLIDTPRQQSRHNDAGGGSSYAEWLAEQAHQRSVPLGRAGSAAEVAAAVCWLLSPTSGYTTGTVIDVTGGHRSR